MRLIHIIPDWNVNITLAEGDSVVQWRALAKDGMDLPPSRQTTGPATLLAGPGETMDFEYQATRPGAMHLDVVQRYGEWKLRVPVSVEPAR